MRHLLAGTTKDDLSNRISGTESSFSGLLPSTNALRHLRSPSRSAVVNDKNLLDMVKQLGPDMVVCFQQYPVFLLVIQTLKMVRAIDESRSKRIGPEWSGADPCYHCLQLELKRTAALARKTLATDYSAAMVKDIDVGQGKKAVYHAMSAIRQTGSAPVAMYEMLTTSQVI